MKKRHLITIIVSGGFGVFLLWALFRTTDLSELRTAFATVRWPFLLLAVALTLLMLVARWMRLRTLLCPGEHRPLFPFFAAMQVSDLLDFVVPFKPGAFLRPYLLAQGVNKSFSEAFAATIVDRLMEVFGIFLVVGTTVVAWPLEEPLIVPAELFGTPAGYTISQQFLEGATLVIGLLVGSVILFLVGLYFQARRFSDLCGYLVAIFVAQHAERVRTALYSFAIRLHVFRSFRHFARVVALNLAFWGLYLSTIGCVFSAFGLNWPWYGPMATMTVFMVLLLGPNVPALVGQYHVAIILSILSFLPATPLPTLRALAITLHLIHIGLVAVLGVIALVLSADTLRRYSETAVKGAGAAQQPAALIEEPLRAEH